MPTIKPKEYERLITAENVCFGLVIAMELGLLECVDIPVREYIADVCGLLDWSAMATEAGLINA